MKSIHSKVLILGSGPAGYTASIYAARANLNPNLVTGISKGGQLMTTTDVDNWPADELGVLGPDLMERFEKHAKRFGTQVIFDQIHTVNLKDKPFELIGDSNLYSTDCLIIATGATAKYLGLDSEKKYIGKGVSACATCDGFFYKNQNVVVVGGGNTAVEESLYLSDIAKKVTLIHRRDNLKAEEILVDKLMEKVSENKISIIWDHTVQNILGDEKGVSGIKIQSAKSKKSYILKDISGVFIAIGHRPNTDIFNGKIEMENGYITTNKNLDFGLTSTNIQGVFAAGDVSDYIYRQAITSAASGCMAALDAKKYLMNFTSKN